MARRLIPGHFNRNGSAKKPYETKQEAQVQAIKQQKNAYICKFCGKWHIGG